MGRSPRRQVLFSVSVLLILASWMFLLPPQGHALDYYWIGTSGNWNDPTNWNFHSLPANGDSVFILTTSTADWTVSYGDITYPDTTLSSLNLDAGGPGNITLSMTSDSRSLYAGIEAVGTSGHASFIQSNGTNGPTILYLGIWSTGSGTYNLSGIGSLLSATTEYVGFEGTGTFTQTGGTNFLSNNLYLGHSSGGEGTYNLSVNGSLSAVSEYVGNSGTGTFTQSGGTNFLSNNLYLGYFSGGIGTYNLNGTGSFSLSAASEYVGNSGHGTFTQTGGTNTVSNQLVVGELLGGHGWYIQSGGGNTITGGGLTVGQNAGSFGSYDLSGNGLLSAPYEIIGDYGTGSFTQSGGKNTITGGALYVGSNGGSIGSYNLSGSGLLSASYEHIGFFGTGTFTQTGGMNSITNTLYLGVPSGGNGTYELRGGSLSANSVDVGNIGIGAFTQEGGTHTTGTLITAANNGSYNLAGGTLTVTSEIINNGAFNFSGGNLTPTVLTNNGITTLSGSGTRTVDGSVVNNRTFNVTGTTAVFTGVFTNNGAYLSDPSTNVFTDLTVGSTGDLSGGAGNQWILSNDFVNQSAQNTTWDTVAAYLEFVTGDGTHDLYLPGVDLGGSMAGYTNNFAWGTLSIAGDLYLYDGNAVLDGALYVGEIFGAAISGMEVTNIFQGGATALNIYYNPSLPGNIDLKGLQYALQGGGLLSPVPIPSTLILFASGLLGLVGLGRRRVKV